MVSDRPMLFDRLEEQAAGFADRADRARRRRSAARARSTSASASIATPPAAPRSCKCVKAAERRLVETQETKSYLGSQGDARFTDLIRPIVFGEAAAGDERIVGLQTPGGCGALRLGAELIARANPQRAHLSSASRPGPITRL